MDSRKYQLFKTEMCRNWQEMDIQENVGLLTVNKNFGTCLYGVRCTFIHDEQQQIRDVSANSSISSSSSLSSSASNSSSSSSSPLFTALPHTFQCYPNTDLSTWKSTMFAKLESNNIWSSSSNSSSFDRRFSSSSTSSTSSLSVIPFI
ncbi:hypothetical protein INT46_005786 [Mucor plumbeus]|uniref:C3H1-type domain-containing protein n=1 Tax=Mucor plumbeus TaxID=97098 RepID=A0A8H7QV37_9FUNG|nr:hypothetical protein INT46_005786 [Mucor plumbeus]